MLKSFHFTPLVFLVLFLSLQAFYLLESLFWYPSLLACELALILAACFVPATRVFAVIFLGLFLWFSASWLLPAPPLPEHCFKESGSLTGRVKNSNFQKHDHLDLIQVNLICGGKSYHFATARLSAEEGYGVKGKFLSGNQVKVKGFKIQEAGSTSLSGVLKLRHQVYNQTWQEARLSRTALFYHLKNKAGYYLDSEAAGLFLALTLADRWSLTEELKTPIQNLGISHLFAISGMHIGVIYLWISFLFRKSALLFRSLLEQGRLIVVKDVIALVLIFFYIQLIGEPISAVRSFEMLFFWVLIRHLLPWQPLWSILFTVAGLMLVVSPLLISRLAFQLSFLSVLAIFLILPLLPAGSKKLLPNVAKKLWSAFLISTWLFFFNLPLILTVFGQLSWVSIPSNLLHILFMSFVFLPFALLVLLATMLGFVVGGLPGEFYLYSMLNGLAKFWAEALHLNGIWAKNWMINWEVDWALWQLSAYWFSLILLSIIAVRFKK